MKYSPRAVRLTVLVLALVGVTGIAASLTPRTSEPPVVSSRDMAAAAQHFLAQLTPERRAKAAFSLESKERADWHFIPRDRPGLSFGEMTDADRTAARELLRTGLSNKGVLKVEAIMALENVLHDLEKGNPVRDPNKYAVMIFDSPEKADGAWGWRLEGHHLCLNFTCVKGEVVSATPMFMGSNPGEARAGLLAGMRVLAAEEDLARDLMKSLSPEQRAKAMIAEKAPDDVLTLPGRPLNGIWTDPPLGISAMEMSGEQRGVLATVLLAEFVQNLRRDLAEAKFERIAHEGFHNIRFCWAGGIEKGQPHYYRIVGPSFVIEYDNTQNDANHVHTVWHDRTRDFGGDALAEHLKIEHGR